MKKITSIILSFVLILTLSIGGSISSSYAFSNDAILDKVVLENYSDKPISRTAINELREDIKAINKYGIMDTMLSSIEVDNDSATYIYSLGDEITTEIKIENDNDDTILTFNENNNGKQLINTVEFLENGDILLDGKKVTFTYDDLGFDTNATSYRTATLPTTCQKAGTSYSHYYTTKYCANINLNMRLCRIGVGALATILCAAPAFFAPIAAVSTNVATALVGFATSTTASEVIQNSENLSSTTQINYRNDVKAFMLNSSYGCQREDVTWYTNKNYKGKTTHDIRYYYYHVSGA